MYCTSCGSSMEPGQRFCISCGKDHAPSGPVAERSAAVPPLPVYLWSPEPTAAPTAPIAPTLSAPTALSAPLAPTPLTGPTAPSTPNTRTKLRLLIGAAVIVLVV